MIIYQPDIHSDNDNGNDDDNDDDIVKFVGHL